MIQQDRLTT